MLHKEMKLRDTMHLYFLIVTINRIYVFEKHCTVVIKLKKNFWGDFILLVTKGF